MNPQTGIRLSIVIVNYNGRHFLDDCLQSIRRLVGCSHEIIVVDNASADGSCDYLRAHYPDIALIPSAINTGFTGGNNLGARHARGEYLLLLNNDTKLLTDVIPAIDALAADADLGVVGGRLFYGDGRQQPSFGFEHMPLRLCLSWIGLASRHGLPSIFRRTETNPLSYEENSSRVMWVSGAFLFTRKSIWDRLGGLDESYFMYVEDVDYCKRVRDAGYRVAYRSDIKTVHYEGAGRVWIGERALLNTMNSYLIYTRKFHGWLGLLVLRLSLGPVMLARAASYAVPAWVMRSQVAREKFVAFMTAGRRLILAPARYHQQGQGR